MKELFTLLVLVLAISGAESAPGQSLRPNVILIYADDLGYGDLGCYGSKTNLTPNLDRMAREGMRFTSCYVGQAVCSASRAALLTGCYPNRVGILGALGPKARMGLHTNETTMAETFKSLGYATAIFGKWHLGHEPEFLPRRQGFDEYYGLPYSNDMYPKHPSTKYPDLPLMQNEEVLELNPDQTKLTTTYTAKAIDFIQRNKEKPFFLYVPHAMPHVPIFTSTNFAGKSSHGPYADVIAELDWSVGEILKTLKAHNLDEKTIVVFSSDNGPWLSYGNHAGSAGNFREGKATVFEGGVRVPLIVRAPQRIPAGRISDAIISTIDLHPTLATLCGTALTKDRRIDGLDMAPLLLGKTNQGSRDTFLFYWGEELQAVRHGPWKLHVGHTYHKPDPAGRDGKPGRMTMPAIGPSLFNLQTDEAETTDLSAANPEVVKELEKLLETARVDLGDSLTKRVGKNVRPAGRLPALIPAP